MEFAWDEDKHHRKLRERGFGFDFAALIFAGPVIEKRDTRKEYGELRMLALGEVEGIVLAVIYHRPRGCAPHYFRPPGEQEGTRRMAIVRKTLDDIKASRPKSDRRRIAATSGTVEPPPEDRGSRSPGGRAVGLCASAKTGWPRTA